MVSDSPLHCTPNSLPSCPGGCAPGLLKPVNRPEQKNFNFMILRVTDKDPAAAMGRWHCDPAWMIESCKDSGITCRVPGRPRTGKGINFIVSSIDHPYPIRSPVCYKDIAIVINMDT